MASTIITKNSSTASAVPVVGDLTKGELAVNVTDKKIYTKDNSAAVVKLVGSLGNQEANAVAITGGSIAGITDLAVADGGTGSSTAAGARSNLSAAASGANSDITSLSGLTTALSVAQGGTGVTSSTGSGSVVLSNSPTLVTPALGTPSAAVLTNATGLPLSTGISGLGTGVATFLGTPSSANLLAAVTDETGTGALVFATSPTLVTPALGTPSALVGTNITGTASGLTAGNVTTNANLTGAVTSVGNATSLGSFSSANLLGALTDETGTGSAVFATSPTLVTPILGTPTSATLTNATGLPISTGVSGLGTGVATFLATPSSANLRSALTDETGTGSAVFATSPTLVTPLLGTPTSGVATNLTGLPLTTGVTGTLPVANGGTNLTSFTSGGVVYASSASALATGSALTFDGTTLENTGKFLLRTSSSPSLAGQYGYNATGGTYIWAKAGSAENFTLYNNTGYNAYTIDSSGNHIWAIGSGSEIFRATSTSLYTASGINVGIGTSSPAARLGILVSGMTNQVLLGANASNSAYGSISLSGSNLDTGRIGLTGGGSTDTNLYIDVPSGGTHQFRNATTTMVTVNSVGNLKTIGTISVGNATPSTSGAGITFPATQSASSDANTLDDYEEGTWTPSVSVSGFTQSVSSTSGSYTKIGNVVTVRMAVNLSSSGRPTSYSEISGIPFTPSATSVGVFAGGNPGAGIQGGSMYASSGGSLFWYATNGTTDSNSWYCTVSYIV